MHLKQRVEAEKLSWEKRDKIDLQSTAQVKGFLLPAS